MRNALLMLAISLVAGCASEIMQGYVGRDITDVILDYGPPENVLELPDGRTAFQWTDTETYTAPATINAYNYGRYTTATAYGGQTSSWDCVYTFFAKPNPQESYTVIGFKKPTLACE